jgi:hypothetical protein
MKQPKKKSGLRIDLVRELTPELLTQGALANQNRYKPESLLATTGVGYLGSNTPANRARDKKLSQSPARAVLKTATRKTTKPMANLSQPYST